MYAYGYKTKIFFISDMSVMSLNTRRGCFILFVLSSKCHILFIMRWNDKSLSRTYTTCLFVSVCLYVLFFNHFFVRLHQYEFGGVDYTHAHNFSVLKHALKKIHSLHTMTLSRRVILYILCNKKLFVSTNRSKLKWYLIDASTDIAHVVSFHWNCHGAMKSWFNCTAHIFFFVFFCIRLPQRRWRWRRQKRRRWCCFC